MICENCGENEAILHLTQIKDNQITFAFSFHFEIGGSRTSWRVLRQ